MAVLPPSMSPPSAPRGFRVGTARAGIKPGAKRKDLALIVADVPCAAAGVFTTNEVRAACIEMAKARIQQGTAQAIVVNSGNANCLSGAQERAWSEQMADAAAAAVGTLPQLVLPASTGVIGEPFPIDRVVPAIDLAARSLDRSPQAWMAAADAIRTTDTFAKWGSVEGDGWSIVGIAKGSGMIHPRMATMLAFFATDLAVPAPTLQAALHEAVRRSFHRISVDGDTSTNDCAIALAHPQGVEATPERVERFAEALALLAQQLAQLIVRDGEGATKFVTVAVTGARSEEQAEAVLRAIATSPLVKTALAGSDANWGRILAAAGSAGAGIQRERLTLWADGVKIVERGARAPSYREEDGMRIFAQAEFTITLDLGLGSASATGWMCDLSYEYVRINAEYRT